MILADTSVWVEHFRQGAPELTLLLGEGLVSIHPVVLGELSVGNLLRRQQTLADLRRLPRATSGTADECLAFIERNTLYGRGIGWNDVQLLVAAKLSGHSLWSLDVRLAAAAGRFGVAHPVR